MDAATGWKVKGRVRARSIHQPAPELPLVLRRLPRLPILLILISPTRITERSHPMASHSSSRTISWRKLFIATLAVAAVLLPDPASGQRPNIVFLFSDDHAAHALSAYRAHLQYGARRPALSAAFAAGLS